MSEKKHIVIGITGGIAAYKSLFLIRMFKKIGYEVKVVATSNALEFVTPLSIETLSNNILYTDTFALPAERDVHHIALADWADCMIVAPATGNIIGKFANGIADDALSTLFLAMNKPLFIAPAMNMNMYENDAVQDNIQKLKSRGCHIIEPEDGLLACGTSGKGRMEEPEIIFETVMGIFNHPQRFKGKKILITAGPTYEPIDPVRFIGNHSSGLMGYALAEVFADQGGDVCLISGPTHLLTSNQSIRLTEITTAQEMYNAVMQKVSCSDIIIMSAAVADYRPANPKKEKIKKRESQISLELEKTPDILYETGKIKKDFQYLIGFALETDHEMENAKKKLQNKNLDLIVLNSVNNPGSGFKTKTNQVTLISKRGKVVEGELKEKRRVAEDIADFAFYDIKQ